MSRAGGDATRGGAARSGGAPWSPAGDGQHPEPKPYVPEPATRPLPPGVGTSTATQPRGGGRLSRSLRPFGRGKNAEPLTPEPTPISAPLPQPAPVTPPLTVTPAPRPEAGPRPESGPRPGARSRQEAGPRQEAEPRTKGGPETEAPPADSKRKPKSGKDEDYVDWVSGLGK
jgi:hypothetical protein